MSKGSTRRPENQQLINDNWDRIFGNVKDKEDTRQSAQHKDQSPDRGESSGDNSQDVQQQ